VTRAARTALAACFLLMGLLVSPALAQAAAGWQSGPLVESQDANCVTGQIEQEAGSFLSYWADPADPPRVGQTYYVAIDLTAIGNTCPGIYADVELALPGGTVPAVSAANPVRCFFEFPGTSSFRQDTSSDCPQVLPAGIYGYELNPVGVNPPFWPLPLGGTVEVQAPVVSSRPLNGADRLQGVVQLADGEDDPVLTPTLATIVDPGSTEPEQRIGVAYPSPSIVGNAQKPDTSAEVKARGYVWNYSNPGSAVAQVAYADATGDCTSPGATVFTTAPASLRNPQTEINATFTGLYADVAYCWRIVAKVTGGVQTGTYEGNWQYLVTAGTYHAYTGEPAAATPLESSRCSADGGGCEASPCAESGCGECAGSCLPGFSGGKTTIETSPAPAPARGASPPSLASPPAPTATLSILRRASAVRAGGRIAVDTGIRDSCPGGGSACSVRLLATVTGQAGKGRHVKPRKLVVGRLHRTIAAGASWELRFDLGAAGAKLLASAGKLKIALSGSTAVGSGPATSLAHTITVKATVAGHGPRTKETS